MHLKLEICISFFLLEKEIFFHVGLGKTATTYLQYKVFPKLKGVHYIQRTRYKRSLDIIARSPHQRIFVSNEFDQQLEREAQWFSAAHPNAKVIIVFRRHDSWIASQYRRFVKNGFSHPFVSFFDIEQDTGAWKRSDLRYFDKIQILEKYFTHKPLLLFYEDMQRDTFTFIDAIARFTGTTYDTADISLNTVHSSYTEKQLKIFRKISKVIYRYNIPRSQQSAVRWVQRIIRQAVQYSLLYAAALIPESMVSKEPLIPAEQLKRIREYFADDWKNCVEYANRNNP